MDLSKRYRAFIAKEKAKGVWIDAHKTVRWAFYAPFLAVLALPFVTILLDVELEAIVVGILMGLVIGSLLMADFMVDYFFKTYGSPSELPPKKEPLAKSKVTPEDVNEGDEGPCAHPDNPCGECNLECNYFDAETDRLENGECKWHFEPEEPDHQCPSHPTFAPKIRCMDHIGHDGGHQGPGTDGNILYWKDPIIRRDDVRQRFETFMEDCWTKYEETRSEKGDSWMESSIPWLYRKLQEERFEVDRSMYTGISSVEVNAKEGWVLGWGNTSRELRDEVLVAFMLRERLSNIAIEYHAAQWEAIHPGLELPPR